MPTARSSKQQTFLLVATSCFITLVCVPCAFGGDGSTRHNWWAFEDHGDKIGTGYVLIEKDGKVEEAHFFIFMPFSVEDDSGRFFRMSEITQEGKIVTAQINALKGAGDKEQKESSHVRIELRDAFNSGTRIRAEVTDPDKDRSKQRPQNVVFVLQGDQWARAK